MIQKIIDEPYRFEFFQAVRLLTLSAVNGAKSRAEIDELRFIFPGQDKLAREAIRFRALASLAFAPAEVMEVKIPPGTTEDSAAANATAAVEMTVSFLGLTGPQGTLPSHYTALLIERAIKKDRSMIELFDIFNHRIISLFYRSWEKYRVVPAFEHAQLLGEDDDLLTQALFSLVGLSAKSLRNQLGLPDAAILYYAGLFSHRPRSARALQQILSDFLSIPVSVDQFSGHWLDLDEIDCSRLPSANESDEGCHNQLGVTMVLGSRVWDVQGAIRIRLGPLNLEQYIRFLPGNQSVRQLCQLTRMFIGAEFQFDYMPVLRAQEIPPCRLGDGEGVGAALGRTAWLRSSDIRLGDADFQTQPIAALEQDFCGAVFVSSEN